MLDETSSRARAEALVWSEGRCFVMTASDVIHVPCQARGTGAESLPRCRSRAASDVGLRIEDVAPPRRGSDDVGLRREEATTTWVAASKMSVSAAKAAKRERRGSPHRRCRSPPRRGSDDVGLRIEDVGLLPRTMSASCRKEAARMSVSCMRAPPRVACAPAPCRENSHAGSLLAWICERNQRPQSSHIFTKIGPASASNGAP